MSNRTDPTRADYIGERVRPDWPASFGHLTRPSVESSYRPTASVQQPVPLPKSPLEGAVDSVPYDSSCRR